MRRRAEKPTVRIPHQTLRQLADEWHAAIAAKQFHPAHAAAEGSDGLRVGTLSQEAQ